VVILYGFVIFRVLESKLGLLGYNYSNILFNTVIYPSSAGFKSTRKHFSLTIPADISRFQRNYGLRLRLNFICFALLCVLAK